MARAAQANPDVATMLPADNPAAWLDHPIEDLLALGHRETYPQQVAALRHRFGQLSGAVSALNKLAKRQGVGQVETVTDALPLFFDHRVYKSYPLSLIETR